MKSTETDPFDSEAFLEVVGEGRTVARYRRDRVIFAQGDPADSVHYVERGKVKLAVVSPRGKEAIIAILGEGSFFGEGCLAGQPVRMATAIAMGDCSIVRVPKPLMIQTLHRKPEFAASFIAHLLTRNIRIEEDLIDHLFNSSEKRLARVLL